MAKGKVGKVLKNLRLKAGLSQKQAYEYIGVAQSTFSSWEVGKAEPPIEVVLDLCELYKVGDVLKAFGYDGYNEDGTLSLNMYEIDIIEKYRTLDNYGQKIINLILDEEVERCTPSEPLLEPISIAYYHQLASAGQGEYIFDDLPTDTIRICRTAEAENADFVLRVRGDSMEPTISDGDLLLIQKTPELKIGDIGIFIDQHDCYVKELGADGLISHNKKYPLITSASGVMCVGKVLGKAEPLNS